MVDLQQGFPQLNTPIADQNGIVTQPWYRLLISLWNRTGQGSGTITGNGYGVIQEEGVNLPQQNTMNFIGAGITASDDAGNARTNITLDGTLNALSAFNTNGFMVQTALDTFTARTISGSAKIIVSNGTGAAGNPVISLGTLVLADISNIDGDHGDITVTSSGATWTIDNQAVTFAKIQNVSANKVLGTIGAGSVQEIDLTSTGRDIIDSTSTTAAFDLLSPLTTKGDLLTFATNNVRLGVGDNGYVPQAASDTTEGIAWRATGVSRPGFIVGRIYAGPPRTGALGSGTAVTADTLYAVPIYIHRRQRFNGIGIHVVTGVLASQVELGIYTNDPSGGFPLDLVLDAGSTSTASSATEVFIPISVDLDTGWYWLVALFDDTPTILDVPASNQLVDLQGLDAINSNAPIIASAYSFGALPDPFGGVTYVDDTDSIIVALRIGTGIPSGVPDSSWDFSSAGTPGAQALTITDSGFGPFSSNMISFGFWVNLASHGTGGTTWGRFISQSDGTAANSSFNVFLSATGRVNVEYYNGSTTNSFIGDIALNTGSSGWNCVVVWIDCGNATAGNRIRCWVDGVEANPGGASATSTTMNNSAVDLVITPNQINGANTVWQGLMYQMVMFNNYLIDASDFYNSGTPIDLSGYADVRSYIFTDSPNVDYDSAIEASWTNVGTVTLSATVP